MSGNASVRGRWLYYKVMTMVGILCCLWFITEVIVNAFLIYETLRTVFVSSPFGGNVNG